MGQEGEHTCDDAAADAGNDHVVDKGLELDGVHVLLDLPTDKRRTNLMSVSLRRLWACRPTETLRPNSTNAATSASISPFPTCQGYKRD